MLHYQSQLAGDQTVQLRKSTLKGQGKLNLSHAFFAFWAKQDNPLSQTLYRVDILVV